MLFVFSVLSPRYRWYNTHGTCRRLQHHATWPPPNSSKVLNPHKLTPLLQPLRRSTPTTLRSTYDSIFSLFLWRQPEKTSQKHGRACWQTAGSKQSTPRFLQSPPNTRTTVATVPCSPRSFTTRERPQTPDKAHMVTCQTWCESRLVTALPACDTALPPLHSTDWGEVCHGEEHCLEPSCPRTNGVASCSHSVNHGGVPPATLNAGTERMRCDSSPTPQPR